MYDVETRVKCIGDMVLGESTHALERKYGVSRKTLRRWRNTYVDDFRRQYFPKIDLPGWDFSRVKL